MTTPFNTHPTVSGASVLAVVIAIIVIVMSGLLSMVSALALLMLLGGGYGTSTFDPLGFFLVILAPPIALVAGIGLLRHQLWAWWCLVALLGIVMVLSFGSLATARESATTRTLPSGTTVTTTTSGPNFGFHMPILVGSALLQVGLWSRGVRQSVDRHQAPFR